MAEQVHVIHYTGRIRQNVVQYVLPSLQ